MQAQVEIRFRVMQKGSLKPYRGAITLLRGGFLQATPLLTRVGSDPDFFAYSSNPSDPLIGSGQPFDDFEAASSRRNRSTSSRRDATSCEALSGGGPDAEPSPWR